MMGPDLRPAVQALTSLAAALDRLAGVGERAMDLMEAREAKAEEIIP